jgi:hypothetical protein
MSILRQPASVVCGRIDNPLSERIGSPEMATIEGAYLVRRLDERSRIWFPKANTSSGPTTSSVSQGSNATMTIGRGIEPMHMIAGVTFWRKDDYQTV